MTEKAKVTADDRVLVLGASGGVGSMIVSLARSTGASVWGQTGSAEKADWIRDLGADEVIVGHAGEVGERADEYRPTVVFDPLGDGFFGAAVKVMADKGRLVVFGTSADPTGEVPLQLLYRKALTVHGYGGLIESDEALARGIREAVRAVAEGRMRVEIDRILPLERATEAFGLLTDRSVRGKIVLGMRPA